MTHPSHDLLTTPSSPSPIPDFEAREESLPRPLDATFPPRPRTPPSTPTTGPISHGDLSDPNMFELTRTKLERAAQGQMNGRRGAPSLRQLVLLSNVWGASQWREEQERERELVEFDRRRKEDEERWLDGVLQEMLVEDGSDDEDEYVELSFRGERDFGDSGFLEEDREHARKDVLAGLAMGRIDEELDYREPSGSKDDDEGMSLLSTLYAPPSPPLPPRSPPIDLPEPSSIYASHDAVDFSSSPPLYPPGLTPDCSPPGLGPASDLLGTSADSFEDHRYDWIEERLSKRLGLLALDLPRTPSITKCTSSYSSTTKASSPLDIASLTNRSSFESLSFGPPTPPRLSHPPHSPSSDSLSLSLVHQSRCWSPRPPRSLSVPPTPRPRTHRPPTHPFPSFSGGIVKSFYDCVDFGSAPSSTPATRSTWAEPDERVRGRDESLALVLAQPQVPWRARAGFRGADLEAE